MRLTTVSSDPPQPARIIREASNRPDSERTRAAGSMLRGTILLIKDPLSLPIVLGLRHRAGIVSLLDVDQGLALADGRVLNLGFRAAAAAPAKRQQQDGPQGNRNVS